jgi:hypothetical protein
MVDPLTPLILDFLDWMAATPRSYCQAMDAWRTSCPKLTVWEDACDRGFIIRRDLVAGQEPAIELTPMGRDFLQQQVQGHSGKE